MRILAAHAPEKQVEAPTYGKKGRFVRRWKYANYLGDSCRMGDASATEADAGKEGALQPPAPAPAPQDRRP